MSADFTKPLSTQNTDDALEQIKANFISLAKMDLVDNNTAPVNSIAYHENKFKKKTNEGWVDLPLTINPENISSTTIRAQTIQVSGEYAPFEGSPYPIEMNGEAGTITAIGNITSPNITSLTQAIQEIGAVRNIVLGTTPVNNDLNIDTNSDPQSTIINIPDASGQVRGLLTAQTQSIGGSKTFLEDVYIAKSISVNEAANFVDVNCETLSVSNEVVAQSTLTVVGNTTLASVTTGAINTNNNNIICGTGSISSSTLSTTGNISVGGTLSVTNTSILSAVISGDITSSGKVAAQNCVISNTLEAKGNTTLGYVTTGTIYTNNNMIICGTGDITCGTISASYGMTAPKFTASSGSNGIFTDTRSDDITEIGSLLIKCAGTTKRVYFDNIVVSNSGVGLRLAGANGLAQETSSLRFKTNIEPLQPEYSENIYKFNPVWYRANTEKTDDPASWSWFGFIAEELAQVEPRLVSYEYKEDDYVDDFDKNGNITKTLKNGVLPTVPRGVHYDKITVLLVDLAQKQKKTIDSLEERIKKLEDLLINIQG